MARDDVLQLVLDFAYPNEGVLTTDARVTEPGVFYDEIMRELGFIELLTGTQSIQVEAERAQYPLEPRTIRILEVHHSASGRLDPTTALALEDRYGDAWRQRRGTPFVFTQEQDSADTITLFPIPDQDGTLTIIRAESRVDVPKWLELPVVFEILTREFLRDSDHQDIFYSARAKLLADTLFALVGVDQGGRRG